MQFLYRRHPEIRMGVELLIKPSRSAFVGADAQEIGSCTIGMGPILFLMPIVAGATVEWPSPSHASLFSFQRRKSKNAENKCSGIMEFWSVGEVNPITASLHNDSLRQSNQASRRGRDRPQTARRTKATKIRTARASLSQGRPVPPHTL